MLCSNCWASFRTNAYWRLSAHGEGRYSFPKAPDNQIYAWENPHILSRSCERIQSLLSRVWGLCGGFFLIPCTISFCQCCSGRPWTSFDVSSMITIYNSHWVGHMGSRDEYSPCLTTQKCFSQVHPRFQPLLLRKKPGDINWLPCRNPHSERAKESLRWMNSSSHLETELHSPGEVSLGLLSPLWNPKVQDPTYLHACMMLASPPACHLL